MESEPCLVGTPAGVETRSSYVSAILGEFVSSTHWKDINPRLREEAKRSLLNAIGCAIAASKTAEVQRTVNVLTALNPAGSASLIGRAERLDLANASFVNALATNLFDFDDTHSDTIIHPTAPVLGPVLALAETLNKSGEELLHALILGMEVECRIGQAVTPMHYARGWHITATCGVFGAAAASSKLLDLTGPQTAMALGIAANLACGLIENLTYFAKNVSVGNASRSGLLAALLAREDGKASPTAIEGRFGWASVMGDTLDVETACGNLGQHWEILNNTYKPYPCGVVFHAAIDAALDLRKRIGDRSPVRQIVLYGSQLLADRGGREVLTPSDARVSASHCVAAAFIRGKATLSEFDIEAVQDRSIASLRDRVDVVVDASGSAGSVRLRIELEDGKVFDAECNAARGSLTSPLSNRELEQKFRENSHYGGWAGAVDDTIALIWQIEDGDNAQRVLQSIRSS